MKITRIYFFKRNCRVYWKQSDIRFCL